MSRMRTLPTSTQTLRVWPALCVGSLLALVVNAPATIVASLIAYASDHQLLLKDAQGTVWHGSAQGVLSTKEKRTVAQVALDTRLNWRIRPTLHHGLPAVQIDMQSDSCMPQPQSAYATLSFAGLKIAIPQHQSQWPASWLSGLGAPWNTLQLQGKIELAAQDVTWVSSQDQTFEGQIKFTLKDISTQLSTLSPLGTYRLDMRGGVPPQLELSTLEGALQLSGKGQWVHQRLQLQGEASAREDAQAALSNLLNVLGQRRGNSSVLNIS